MDPQRLAILLQKNKNGTCSPAEKSELDSWYDSLENDMTPPFISMEEELLIREQVWNGIAQKRAPGRSFRLPVWARAAAVILPLAVLGYWFASGAREAAGLVAEQVKNPFGSTMKDTLPDGTLVWLNAGSELTYAFDSGQRKVRLKGEAFFDVQKDANRPFVIEAGKMDVRVLGTALNVKAYPDDATMETSLVNGAIEVTLRDKPDRKFLLKPNEKIVLLNKPRETSPGMMPAGEFQELRTQGYAVSNVSIHPTDSLIVETAWTTDRLAFMNERFEDIALQLERKYEVKFHFNDTVAKALRFTATFENEDMRQTLEALQYTATKPFKFQVSGKNVYITN